MISIRYRLPKVDASGAGMLLGVVSWFMQIFLPAATALWFCLCVPVYAGSQEWPDDKYPGPVVPEREEERQSSAGFDSIFPDDGIEAQTDHTYPGALPPEHEVATDEEEPQPSTERESVAADDTYPGPVAPEREGEGQPSVGFDNISPDDEAEAQTDDTYPGALPPEHEVATDEEEPQPSTERDSVVADDTYPDPVEPERKEEGKLSAGLDGIFTKNDAQVGDVTSFENVVARFRLLRMGIALSLAECEGVSLCSPLASGDELDTLIQLLDRRVNTLILLRDNAESAEEFDELLVAYASEKDSMERLADDLEGLEEIPADVSEFESLDTDIVEADLTEDLELFEDEELFDDESLEDELSEDFSDDIPSE